MAPMLSSATAVPVLTRRWMPRCSKAIQRRLVSNTIAGNAVSKLEFFFDCSSPWTYLAFARIHDVVARTGAEIVWKPVLVGGIFNAVNQDVYTRRANPDPRKASYSEKDLADWARLAGIRIGKPPVFPVRATAMMRCAVVAEEDGKLVIFAKAAFE